MLLSSLGFATVGAFLALILLARMPVLPALLLTPLAAALLGGFGGQVGGFALDGIRTVAPVAAMMMFAVLYFGLMLDTGLFEPLIRGLLRIVRDDPVRLCLVSALLPMLVAFDGDGATTFLISITALKPAHRRLGMNPLVLPAIVALAAGVMNLLPWGGPTARAITVLKSDVASVFVPVIPAMLAGIAWVFAAAFVMGWRERRRLAVAGVTPHHDGTAQVGPIGASPPTSRRVFCFNAILTAALIALLFQGLYGGAVGLPAIHPAVLFMVAFAVALPVNRCSAAAQQDQLAIHAASVVLVTSMILAAGVFTGILSGTGMIKAMAGLLAGAVPQALAPWLSTIIALTGMPLSLVFTPDAYYFGVLPVFAQTAAAVGRDPLEVGRAAILGQMTTGFPLSPLTASTFILIGLSGVSLRDHQRFVFGWAFGTTVVMTGVAMLVGAI